VKFAFSLALLVIFSLTACTTSSNYRAFYSPAKPHGPWTTKKRGLTLAGRYDHRSATHVYVIPRSGPVPTENEPTPAPAPAAQTPALPAQ